MALTHLADTSVLTRLAQPPVRTVVRPRLAARTLACCRLTLLELGHSARNASEWDDIARAAGAFRLMEVEPPDLRRAGEVQRMLADAGLRGRKVPDLVIAAVAERAGLTVLHYDRDVDLIAGVTGQRVEWLVPRGSID